MSKSVAIVGCGAVGSHAALALAATGVGTIRLFDPETLAADNIHRHALGAESLGALKVEGLKKQLEERFPHVRVETHPNDILDVIRDDIGTLAGVNAVVVALGDPTIERRVNALMGFRVPRVHVWLEPLGLGGHVLLTGISGQLGCYECIVSSDQEAGLFQRVTLVRPGQTFQRSIAGCAGTFTPYGIVDAQRASGEATRVAVRALQGLAIEPLVKSWLVSKQGIQEGGYVLSARGLTLAEGSEETVTDFHRADCPVCQLAR